MERNRDIELLAALPQPTIAAVNGYALGGGLEMALACDFRVVAEHATLGLPEVSRGLVPGGGVTQRLPRFVGYAAATELVLLGRTVQGDDAVSMGLATACVPGDRLVEAASELARSLAELPADAVRGAKRLLRRSTEVPVSVGVEEELEALVELLQR